MTKPAIDYVSPLPPVRSGIADYSADLLAELAPLCDLRLVHLPGQEVAPAIRSRYEVVKPEALDPSRRLPYYHLGNNVYHKSVCRLASASPGVATVHDLRLHHLLVETTLGDSDLYAYIDALRDEHGWEGAAVAKALRWGVSGTSRLFELPAHGSLLLRQRGLLVHSEWGRRFLVDELSEHAGGGRLPEIRHVPMPMPTPDPPSDEEAAAWRRRLGVPQSAVLLGSFGFQTPIKRTDVLLRALTEPGLEKVHTVVAGEAVPQLDLAGLVRDLEIQNRVTLTGFLSEAEFPIAIAGCDACINLRYPTAGETSASLLRILALGRPAVVSDYGQFAELPGDVVVKAPLGDDASEEARELAELLRGLLAAPERLQRMGAKARNFIEREHRPAAAAAAVAEALAEWSRQPAKKAPVSGISPNPPRPTSLTWGWLPGRIEVEGCEPPWAEGEQRKVRIVVTNTGFATWLSGQHAEGGVVFEPQLWRRGRDLFQDRPWIALPRDLLPGEACRIEFEFRKPTGRSRLRFEPHLFGSRSMTEYGLLAFDREL